MKRYLAVLLSVLLFAAGTADSFAQSRYGIIGGATFSTKKIKEFNSSTLTRYHIGLTYKLDLPAGFSFQPSLIYNVKGSNINNVGQAIDNLSVSMGFIEVPLSIQWGPDLLVFRPFLDVTPFIGYAVNKKLNVEGTSEKLPWNDVNRLEYGLGLGFGVEIWRIQVIARYNWNFGDLYKSTNGLDSSVVNIVKTAFDDKNFGGVTLTAAILFGGGRR